MIESTSSPHDGSKQAKGEARQRAEEAKDEARSVLDEQKRATADGVGGVAQAAQRTAEQLSDQHQDALAGYVRRGADALEQFSGSLREQDIDSLMHQTRDFARRQPAVFIGGAIATGFVLARFFNSSASRSESAYSTAAHGERARHQAEPPIGAPPGPDVATTRGVSGADNSGGTRHGE